jgi:hypothetical protein
MKEIHNEWILCCLPRPTAEPSRKRRHQRVVDTWDVVFLGAIVSAVVTRRVQLGVVGATVGVAIAVVAHLFQPGTVRAEVTEVLQHPIWALRAEGQRIFGRRP